jgi:hypothetical protein
MSKFKPIECTCTGCKAFTMRRFCRECIAHNNRLRNYGMTKDEYQSLLQHQNERCAICKKPAEECPLPRVRSTEKRCGLCVDHCHATGKVRALLCHPCNTMLGASRDDSNVLHEAARYLERFRGI